MNFKQASKDKIHLNISKHGVFELSSKFVWYIDFATKNEYVIIPKGFKTDLGSIPIVLRIFIDYTYLSFISHDYFYSGKAKVIINDINKLSKNYTNMTFTGNETYARLTRREADIELIKSLQVEGMGKFKRNLVYIGVRIFGGLYFKKK